LKVRTRFAPSPTGALHMGGVRTALFNYLYARGHHGSFILRMEDTDRARSRPEYERSIMEDLLWLGLSWDEGPDKAGSSLGPFRQSERGGLYQKFAKRLLEAGLAYPCRCTRERLAALRKEQAQRGLPPRYDGRCRAIKSVPEGVEFSVRFRVPAGREVRFTDLLHGPRVFSAAAFGDFIIMTPTGSPAYNFAAAVDDGLMEISHVIRGDDHLPNTPLQVLVMEALGLRVPLYAHLPLVLGKDQRPLGKREGMAGVRDMREGGFLPLAVLNAAARLGWAPGAGLMALEEMAASFRPERLSKSPSVFDAGVLRGFNREALAAISANELGDMTGLTSMTGPARERERIREAVEAVRGNAVTLLDIRDLAMQLLERPVMDEEALRLVKAPEARAVISALLEGLDSGVTDYETLMKSIGERTGIRGRALYMPIRLALTGSGEGIGLRSIFSFLGPLEVAARLREALGPGEG